MGKPLTPQLHRIPANLRERAEQAAATNAAQIQNQRGFVPTPERLAQMEVERKEKEATLKTAEEREAFEQEQERNKANIQNATLSSANTLLDLARRGDQVAGQFAPNVLEAMAELREIEQQLIDVDFEDETTRAELEEARDEVYKSMQDLVSQGALPAMIEDAMKQPTEAEAAQIEQRQLEVREQVAQTRTEIQDRARTDLDLARTQHQERLARQAVDYDAAITKIEAMTPEDM